MKAVILVAGVGSRLRPLTDNTHKALLPIGESSTLRLMVSKLARHGIESFVMITGNREQEIRTYLTNHFPELTFQFVSSDRYLTTNTGYSLMLARPYVQGETFLKLDGDVNFDEEIISRLLATPDDASYVCVDATAVDEEVIKVQINPDGSVLRIGNTIPVEGAVGESIGIEKISGTSSHKLLDKLEQMMEDPANHQKYYEHAYDEIVQEGEPFGVVDITGLNWVEMDTLEDYEQALKYFAAPNAQDIG